MIQDNVQKHETEVNRLKTAYINLDDSDSKIADFFDPLLERINVILIRIQKPIEILKVKLYNN